MITDEFFPPLQSRYLVSWKCNKESKEQVKEVRAGSAIAATATVLHDSDAISIKLKSQDNTEYVMKVKGYYRCTVAKI